jgi:prepilin-type N-terminal cleavage/methylation domain-containing protein
MFPKVSRQKGFTLLEIIVSVAVFGVVMVVAGGALLNIIDANRKAQVLGVGMNNVNFAMDTISRRMRLGSNYHCDIDTTALNTPRDCVNANSVAFEGPDGDPAVFEDQIMYRLNSGVIEESLDGGETFIGLTSPDLVVDKFSVSVKGSLLLDEQQPRAHVVIAGYVDSGDGEQTRFNLYTTITQRLPDS